MLACPHVRIGDGQRGTFAQHKDFRVLALDGEKSQRGFIQNDFLKESHGLELLKLSKLDNFAPWLTRA